MAGTAGAAAAALPRSRLRYGKDAAGNEILIMMAPGEEEEDEGGAVAQDDREASITSSIISRPSTATTAAPKPYQGTNTIVMMEWEKEYMETLVEALAIREEDEVLEIGWGLGYSATAFQRHRPRRHVIVECDPGVMARAEEWKKRILKNEEEEKEEKEQAADSKNESNSSSSSSKKRSIVLVQGYWQQALPSLGQFTAVLMDDFPLPVEGPGAEDEARVLASTGGGSRWHHFLDLIVSHHLRPGGRVTGYLSRDLELGRSDCSYTRRPTEVLVPPNCTYATPGRQTYFVPLVTRKVGGGEGGGGVGLGFITGRGRGDVEISRQDQGEGGEEGQEGMALDTKAARKRRRMLAYVLEERGGRRRMMTIAE